MRHFTKILSCTTYGHKFLKYTQRKIEKIEIVNFYGLAPWRLWHRTNLICFNVWHAECNVYMIVMLIHHGL